MYGRAVMQCRALADALEFAVLADSWLVREFVRDYYAGNDTVVMRVKEPYVDASRCRRNRTVLIPTTMRAITSIARAVVDSRHV
jgi:hypothetical protein